MNIKKTMALAAATICMGAGLVMSGTAAAQAASQPGLPRLHAYCQHLGHMASAATDVKSVWSWRCVGARGEWHRFDMNDACRWHYPNGPQRAAYHNASDAFSWYCY